METLKVLEKKTPLRNLEHMQDNYKVYTHRGILVIEILVERFDFFEISESSGFLRTVMAEHRYPSMIFNLSKAMIIDSSVFGFIIEIRNAIDKNGNELVIVCRNRDILYIMDMLKITQIMRVFPSVDAAADYLLGN
ncbi:MAG: hypothetical protein A2176_10990 [Spirochaetes bacterium RBG_13_51_14]|nr:MAG: hypothetical protein A2176_10990 [Spirochaetes bacterium RBG_13_51_14]